MNEDIEELRFCIDKILVNHAAFENVISRIQRCYDGALYGSDPTCLAIIGESRTGKTRSLEHFESKYPRLRSDMGVKVPVLHIKVPSKPTVKGLVTELLYALQDPLYAKKATEQDKTLQLKAQLRRAQTKLIFLDEFQHFIDQGTQKIQHQVTDWLKMVVDDTRIGLVVSGLPSSLQVISRNDQLLRRFQEPALLKRFNWINLVDQNEFRSILYNIQINMKPFQMPDLDSDEMALRMYVASGGLMGYVIKILREATSISLQNKSTSIDLNVLNESYHLCIMDKVKHIGSPFSKDFNFTATEKTINDMIFERKLGMNGSEDASLPVMSSVFRN